MADAAWSDLARRAISGILMAAAALAAAWWGGWCFALFWAVAAGAVLVEWIGMVVGTRAPAVLATGGTALAAAALAAALGQAAVAVAALAVGAAGVGMLLRGRPQAVLAALGVPYAGAAVVPIVLLRADAAYGFAATLFVFAVVWGSDIMAYFTGRALGGPKLWPRVSPKKTWSGFLGGTLFGALGGWAVAAAAGAGATAVLFGLAVVLAVVSQGGDLLESALKRRFGTKDASHLIPGHGGVMDRLDGFVVAALVALVLGMLGSPLAPARALLAW